MKLKTTLFILGALVLGLVSYLLDDLPVDDAYISFRYAQNLSDGQGLCFNPGERVEGYTNFLWVVLLSAASFVHHDLPLLAQLLALLFSILTLLVFLDLPGVRGRPLASVVGLALLLASAPLVYWGQNGLETSLFTFLVLLGFRCWTTGEGRRLAATVALALATLTRPEGALVFAALLAVDIAFDLRAGRPVFRSIWLRPAAGFLVFLLALESFRWLYFGSLLPNTYFAKLGGLPTLSLGLVRFYGFSLQAGGLLYLAGLLFVIWKDTGKKMRRTSSGLLALALVYLAYLVYSGGDIYYLYRFYVPLVPLLTVGLVRLICATAERWGAARPALLGVAMTLAAGAWLASPWWVGKQHESRLRSLASDRSRVAIAEWMAANLPEDSSIALNPIGIIPYITGFETYDMVGLTDPRIATRDMAGKRLGAQGHRKYDGFYILSRRPDYIVLSNAVLMQLTGPGNIPYRRPTRVPAVALEQLFQRDFLHLPGDAEIYASALFATEYECWIVPVQGNDNFVLFKRTDRLDVLTRKEPVPPA